MQIWTKKAPLVRASAKEKVFAGGQMARLRVTVNGIGHAHEVEPRMLLVHYLRETLGLTVARLGEVLPTQTLRLTTAQPSWRLMPKLTW